jgi:hypothetical protein
MKGREIGNTALHLGGAAAMVAAVWWHDAMIIPVIGIWAWLREQAQHRYILTRSKGWAQGVYSVEKRSFWDWSWVTWHRVWEAAQWPLGAAVCYGLLSLLR